MTFRALIILSITAAAGLLPACRQNDYVPVPRRTAYPRIDIPTPVYKPAPDLPLHFEVNSATTISDTISNGSVWVDIRYPRQGVTVHCTLTPVSGSDVRQIMDNRIERLSLNTGGATSEMTELHNNAGFDCRLIVTRAESPTPVQFIATDRNRWVVSGSAYLNAPRNTNPDSIAPIVGMLERDFLHTIQTIRP